MKITAPKDRQKVAQESVQDLALTAPATIIKKNRVGRPRLGTEAERLDLLLDAATTVFLEEGYGLASIAQIARAAGVSTRTIYENFSNKSALLIATVKRLVVNELTKVIEDGVLETCTPDAALTRLGTVILTRVTSPDAIRLYRLGLAEVARNPDLAETVYQAGPMHTESLVAGYLKAQVCRGTLEIDDPVKAARLFIGMVTAAPLQIALFGLTQRIGQTELDQHIKSAVQLFLRGTLPREK
ncbi:TetR/AcrR family transcriptional regulator [Glaciimonas sp. Gout2]|uniref:TetR/AcrR family transcriptional regulator n=2 Tax=Glaciimonas TaxID=1229970 RepID=UPI002AB41F0D|nr:MULTISPECIES: TetR/AcrR family transcriptional regulator [unclassified Glaciimonas]MDY7548782.1 TetR/AcrR family transcriptional regulator [Glaciimonas sp. CA11.2]MEB0012429.1 TetR/AcrR family transcriptional regulator [Glaciimonas sp. Cout2]MEB0082642.1 TetR/AcrR family transcriptional regulator [Glaciimonas sp. Gout2]